MESTSSPSSSPRVTRLQWTAAVLLTGCGLVASLATVPAAPTAGAMIIVAVPAVTSAAVLAILAALRRRHDAVRGEIAHLTGAIQQQYGTYRHQLAALNDTYERRLSANDDKWSSRAVARTKATTDAIEDLLRNRLPAALNGESVPAARSSVPAARADAALDERVVILLDDVLTAAAESTKRGRDREESARLAVVALSRRVQTSAHRIQEEASLMADRHQHLPDVVESTMRVDHAAAQQGRHAQSVAVLCGEPPGQQWQEPLALVDVVRAAAGRIVAYKRVEVSGDIDLAAASQVVEPLIHVVAELLANATQCSPPSTDVLVTVRSVQRGAVIEINDCGIGMDENQLRQARAGLARSTPVGLSEVGEIPQTGLAVVGRYVLRHGFRADLSDSPYGGVRAVVLVPAEAVATLRLGEPAGRRSGGRSGRSLPGSGARPERDAADARTGESTGGPDLPRRRSRRRLAATAGADVTGDAVRTAAESPAGVHSASRGTDTASRGTDTATSDVGTAGSAHTLDSVDPEEAGRWMSAFLRPRESGAEAAPGSGSADPGSATGPAGGSAGDPAAGPAGQATDDHSKG